MCVFFKGNPQVEQCHDFGEVTGSLLWLLGLFGFIPSGSWLWLKEWPDAIVKNPLFLLFSPLVGLKSLEHLDKLIQNFGPPFLQAIFFNNQSTLILEECDLKKKEQEM